MTKFAHDVKIKLIQKEQSPTGYVWPFANWFNSKWEFIVSISEPSHDVLSSLN